MRLAVVSMTYNDGYKIKEWREHFEEYKDEANHFVIVDNGSEKEYLELLKATFPEAIIIERSTNGGCTAAYNDGIRYILENTDDDAIAIVANDMKLSPKCLTGMYEFLFKNEQRAIVSTPVLDKESDVVDNFGHTFKYFGVKNDFQGKKISDIVGIEKDTDLVSGGFYMAKRLFFEKAGLQDENLFMYCDELDTMFSAKKYNFIISVTSSHYAWHHHIKAATEERHPQTAYMISRNRMYVAKKHLGVFRSIMWWFYTGLAVPLWFIVLYFRSRKKIYLSFSKYSFIGGLYGAFGNMKPNKYSLPIIKEKEVCSKRL